MAIKLYNVDEKAQKQLDKCIDAAVLRRDIPLIQQSAIDYASAAEAWVEKAKEREQEIRKQYGYYVHIEFIKGWRYDWDSEYYEYYRVSVVIAPLSDGKIIVKFAGQSNYAYKRFGKNEFSKMLKYASQLSSELLDAPVVFVDLKRKIPTSFKPKILYNGTKSEIFHMLCAASGKPLRS